MGLFKEKVLAEKKFRTFGVRLPIELVDKLADAKKKVKQMGLEWTFDEEVQRFCEKLIEKNEAELKQKFDDYLKAVNAGAKRNAEQL